MNIMTSECRRRHGLLAGALVTHDYERLAERLSVSFEERFTFTIKLIIQRQPAAKGARAPSGKFRFTMEALDYLCSFRGEQVWMPGVRVGGWLWRQEDHS